MKKITILSLVFIAISCKPQLYIPVSNAGNTTLENLTLGRKLYIDNCASCHRLYLPKQYNATQWQKYLDEMQERSKISNEQKKLIFSYLTNQTSH